MGVRFFVDENLGRNLVEGLRALGYENIEHIHEHFPPGEPDENWLQYVGQQGLVLITKDRAIRRNPKEKAALAEHNIVAFYLGGKNMGIKEVSRQLINAWPQMEACAEAQQKKGMGAAFIIRPRGGKFDVVPLS